jgi:hypothetical protein
MTTHHYPADASERPDERPEAHVDQIGEPSTSCR